MEHTRNQKRMYRIKKLEEKIVDLENISKKAISELTIANDKLKKIEEYVNENLIYIDNAEDQEIILEIIKWKDITNLWLVEELKEMKKNDNN